MSLQLSKRRTLITTILLVLAAIGMYGLLPQVAYFNDSWRVLSNANIGLAALAAAAALSASIFTAAVYVLISLKPLRFGEALLVQLSGLLINRIFPAGIGGVGLNFLYLKTHKHTATQAGVVVALNNSLGLLGHVLILAVVAIFYWPSIFAQIQDYSAPTASLWVGLVVIVLGVALYHVLKRRIYTWLRTVRKQLRIILKYYKGHVSVLAVSLLLSCFLTLSNATALWASSMSLGVSISFGAIFLILTFGVAAATVTPTPGGIGGAEAAIAAGFITQGVDGPTAVAIALLYRLISFWFGLVVGACATVAVRAKRIVVI